MRVANEVRVGVVVVLALLLAVTGYFFLRGVGLGAEMYYVRLSGPANIAVGNDVHLQGVKVGQVQAVTLDKTTQNPLVTLALARNNPPFALLKRYQYSVQSSAIIGENYVDIRGPFDPNAPTYRPNDPTQLIPGTASAGIAGITDQATLLAKDMRATLGKFNVTLDRVNKGILSYDNQIRLARTLNGVALLTRQVGQSFGPRGMRLGFGDPRAQQGLNETLENTAMAAAQAGVAARNINQLTREFSSTVAENRAQLHDMLGNFNRTAQNVAGLTETLDFALRKGGFMQNAQAAFGSLRRAASNVESGTASFKTLAADPALVTNLRDTTSAIRESTQALRDTADSIRGLATDPTLQGNVKGVVASLNTTAGTLATATANLRDISAGIKNVVGDPQVQEDLKASVSALRGTLETARGTLEATRATAERIDSLLGGRREHGSHDVGATAGTAGKDAAPPQHAGYAPGGISFTYRNLQGARPPLQRNYGDIDLNTTLFGGPFRLGLAGVGETNDLTLESGRFVGRDAALRYGLFRGKLALGADLHRGRFLLEGNVFDPNRHSYSLLGGVRVASGVDLLLGREGVPGAHANTIGVRFHP